jgi:maltose O-acetyltransferase
MKYFWLVLYYGFAYHLPATYSLGKIGLFSGHLRRFIFKRIAKKCGHHVNIERHAFFGKGFDIELGNYSDLGIDCHVPNNIKIGDYVMMGPKCHILSNHTHNTSRLDIPMQQQGKIEKPGRTIIGNDVWIGRQVLFTGGKHVGNHVIIGAGSVVCKDIEDYAVVGGNPIRIIRYRNK